MAEERGKGATWTIHPPGSPKQPGTRELRLSTNTKPTDVELSKLANKLIGASLTRVEFDEYQLRFLFSNDIQITVFYAVVYYPEKDISASFKYFLNNSQKNFTFMEVLGKVAQDARADEHMNLILKFKGFGKLKIVMVETAIESYMITEPMPGSFLTI